MKNPQTANEFAHAQYFKRREAVLPGQTNPTPPTEEQVNDMIEFAKLHVQAALEAAAIDATTKFIPFTDDEEVDRDSIRNAYPLDNVK